MGILHTELMVRWQYQAHTSKNTAPRKEMCHSPEWDEVSSELAYETNLTMHLGSMSLGVHLDSTFVVTCE